MEVRGQWLVFGGRMKAFGRRRLSHLNAGRGLLGCRSCRFLNSCNTDSYEEGLGISGFRMERVGCMVPGIIMSSLFTYRSTELEL